VGNALAQSADHVLSFFAMLRTELAFHIGCLNLRARLADLDEPMCFPEALPATMRTHGAEALYDICLALTMGRQVVGNDLFADGKDLVIITGANQGGKSTFLRSIGLAQTMMQAGMFVAARSFRANTCRDLFTHYKREEDATLKSGKFDEEVARMSDIADELRPDCMVLFNESFSATNEREGSEIARQVVAALGERRVKIFFVTHQYEFAHGEELRGRDATLFLRATRQEGGTRSFKVAPGEPLPTSYGEDLYRAVFLSADAA
jgi:DNA mismatch repair ATPase MutS